MDTIPLIDQVEDANKQLAESAQTISALTVERDALSAQLSEIGAQLKSTKDNLDASSADLVVANSKLAESVAEVARLNADLTAAAGKLALAQFGDIGGTAPVADGAEGARSAKLIDQFRAISDPAERTAFYRKNRKEMLAEGVTK
jgi:septal ring factor EnvC (AmiA/AmiB activator)